MPTHIRSQIAFQVDSMLPRDVHTITPCFRHQNVLPTDDVNWQTLCDDLHNGIKTWLGGAGSLRQMTTKLYEIVPPSNDVNRPRATKQDNAGAFSPTSYPGEVCCCLSFYGGSNNPWNRGRLYIPVWMYSGAAPTKRPNSSDRTQIGTLVPIFAGLGGVNVDWIVWSKSRSSATKVTNWFVDDEYDTQRRRGLRPTARTAGTTGG